MKLARDKKLAIVGGGPGGLTLARLLQMHGANVTVYERDHGRAARNQGATLDLHDDSGLKALRAAGLMAAFNANYRPGADRLVIMDHHGQIVLEEFSSGDLGAARPEIDRGPLRELLIDSLAAGTVVWGSQLASLARVDGRVRLQFSDGTSTLADLVIAADGASSRVRPYLTPIKPLYSGVTVVEGLVDDAAMAVPEIHRLLNHGKICALGDGKTLFVISKGTAVSRSTPGTKRPKDGRTPAASILRAGAACCAGSGASSPGGASGGTRCLKTRNPASSRGRKATSLWTSSGKPGRT